jgi:2-iminobutanoate/2-iminopropanoate deaminase
MSKTAVSTDGAPKAIGPYSQAVRAGDYLFTSGQVGLDPATGTMVPGGIEAETRRVLESLTAVLAAGGASWADVVRTTIYLTDLNDFAIVNKLYGEVAGEVPPARATVQVAALPRGAVVEIDAVAYVRDVRQSVPRDSQQR